jgi:hypothetical protein
VRDLSKANPLNNVYFGEQHIVDLVHIRVYADAEEMSRLAFIISC